MASICPVTFSPCWPTRSADGSLKLLGVSVAGVVLGGAVWPAPTAAGVGVAGGTMAVVAAFGWGAGGGAGVDVETEGVEGVACFGGAAAAGAAFGWIEN